MLAAPFNYCAISQRVGAQVGWEERVLGKTSAHNRNESGKGHRRVESVLLPWRGWVQDVEDLLYNDWMFRG
jgi:hypothetical protein